MQYIKTINTVKKLKNKLKENDFPFKSIYLFGSFARRSAHEFSDIDIAVVTNIRKTDKNKLRLSRLSREIDSNIEIHFFKTKDFYDDRNIMACEIIKTGIKI